MMYSIIKPYLLLSILCFFGCNQHHKHQQNEEQKTPPNILFIISDDQAWTDYGFMGHEVIETPHLDRLADQSLVYTRGYVTAPLCSPSLISIITGLYPHEHGITGNDPTFHFDGKKWGPGWLEARKSRFDTLIELYHTYPNLNDFLHQRDYLSFQTGKWWIGSYRDGGFDYGMTHGDPTRKGRHGDEGLTIGRQGLDTIASFLDLTKERGKPFFLWYAPFLPHSPHTPPDSLLQKYLETTDSEPLARYRANVEWFDMTVGRLLSMLQQKGLADHTMIFYVCDNGWVQDPDKRNKYMEGSKRAPYDMGIRTPIMVSWPGHIEPEFDTTTLASSIDLVPTVLEWVGMEQPTELTGLALTDPIALKERGQIFASNFAHDIESMQHPELSLLHRIIVEGEWKLIEPSHRNLPEQETELYYIINDPFEQVNLAGQKQKKADELQQQLDQWWNPAFKRE